MQLDTLGVKNSYISLAGVTQVLLEECMILWGKPEHVHVHAVIQFIKLVLHSFVHSWLSSEHEPKATEYCKTQHRNNEQSHPDWKGCGSATLNPMIFGMTLFHVGCPIQCSTIMEWQWRMYHTCKYTQTAKTNFAPCGACSRSLSDLNFHAW